MEHLKMVDWRGTPIVPGAIIVYPGRQGSHHWMMEAEVLELLTVSHWDREIPAILVQPLRQGSLRTSMKPVRLTALERVTVIPKCDPATALVEHFLGVELKSESIH